MFCGFPLLSTSTPFWSTPKTAHGKPHSGFPQPFLGTRCALRAVRPIKSSPLRIYTESPPLPYSVPEQRKNQAAKNLGLACVFWGFLSKIDIFTYPEKKTHLRANMGVLDGKKIYIFSGRYAKFLKFGKIIFWR